MLLHSGNNILLTRPSVLLESSDFAMISRCIRFLCSILLFGLVMSRHSSAAVITPPLTRTNGTPAIDNRKLVNLASRTHCIIEAIGPRVPVSSEHCGRALRFLFSRSDIDIERTYSRVVSKPIRLTWPPCVIGMDRRYDGHSKLQISPRQVIMSVISTLELCQEYGQGGWQYIEWDPDWIVFVEGV